MKHCILLVALALVSLAWSPIAANAQSGSFSVEGLRGVGPPSRFERAISREKQQFSEQSEARERARRGVKQAAADKELDARIANATPAQKKKLAGLNTRLDAKIAALRKQLDALEFQKQQEITKILAAK